MNEKKLNMFAKQEEYAALRNLIKIVESSGEGGMAASVKRAIDRELTRRQRQMVYMYYLEQMRMQDIADDLGLSISSVSRTIKRGRRRLKSCLRYGGKALMDAMED